MGWFSKRRSSNANQGQQSVSEPFVADDRTLARVAELMTRFNDAVGNDAALNTTVSEISAVGGLGSLEQLLGSGNVDELMNRPWRMLAAVAQRAAQNGNHFLAARIFGFMFILGTVIAPHLTRGDLIEMLMSSRPPKNIEVEIATVALGSLQQIPGDQIIFGNATGAVPASKIFLAAANVIVQAPAKGVPVDESVITVAKRIVG